MFVLDLCAGLKGASDPMKEIGFEVITLDYDPAFNCTYTADVRDWHYPAKLPKPDIVWASPPCEEFSREFMPWCKTGVAPDMSIVLACKRLIEEIKPKFWIIENTAGAVSWFRPYLGSYRMTVGPFHLWGFFPPPIKVDQRGWHKKSSMGSKDASKRAIIPKSLSLAIARSCRDQVSFDFPVYS